MKLIVKNVFRDKEDHVTVYEPGTILEVNNSERASDLVKRGLCEKYEGKDVAAFTLGKPAAKTSVKGNAAKTAKKETKKPATGTDRGESTEGDQVPETNDGDTKEQ